MNEKIGVRKSVGRRELEENTTELFEMKDRFKYKTLDVYEVSNLGLPYPVSIVDSAIQKQDTLTGSVSVSIPDFEGFLASLGIVRAMVANKLLGSEIRFLRKVIGLKSKEFAGEIGVDPATISRWENGNQLPSEDKERILRIIVIAMLAERAPRVASQFEPLMTAQMALKTPFEKGYKPKLVFNLSRSVSSIPEAWFGKEAA